MQQMTIQFLCIHTRENGLQPDVDSYTALVAMYGEAGDMDSIMKVCNYFMYIYMCCFYTPASVGMSLIPES